jgi:hypothetical protein
MAVKDSSNISEKKGRMNLSNKNKNNQQSPSYITLPTSKAEKTDPEVIWEKQSWHMVFGDEKDVMWEKCAVNLDNVDDDDSEARVVTNAVIEP